jgi:tetratricopeptide (TPR) repeat protein
MMRKQGKHNEAISDFNTAITINPKYTESYYARGLINISLGNLKIAKEDIQKALDLVQETGNQFLEGQIQRTLSHL